MGLGVRDAVNHEAQGSHICLDILVYLIDAQTNLTELHRRKKY